MVSGAQLGTNAERIGADGHLRCTANSHVFLLLDFSWTRVLEVYRKEAGFGHPEAGLRGRRVNGVGGLGRAHAHSARNALGQVAAPW